MDAEEEELSFADGAVEEEAEGPVGGLRCSDIALLERTALAGPVGIAKFATAVREARGPAGVTGGVGVALPLVCSIFVELTECGTAPDALETSSCC